ncbi:hypothetical protein DFH06DRAFT_1370943 [Mycena polygramma]|nr:hypothetical protein DFH06DRAFT_1370943 [Mycena polygramma]
MLERLPRLRRIHMVRAQRNQIGAESLCSLANLKHLNAEQCSVDPECGIDTTNLTLRVSSFVFRDNLEIYTDARQRGDPPRAQTHWGEMRDRESLYEVDASPVCHLFTLSDEDDRDYAYSEKLPPFPNVRKLSAWMMLENMEENAAVLEKFPAGSPEESDELPEDVLPVLAEYTGSYETLHLFLPKPTLARLIITKCDPEDLIIKLEEIDAPATLTSLDLTFTSLTNSDLDSIMASFPDLTALRISGKISQPKRFIETLASSPDTLPPTLQRFALPELAKVRDALVVHCPALEVLWLDGEAMLLRWHKSKVDGTVHEKSATDIGTVNTIRDEEAFAPPVFLGHQRQTAPEAFTAKWKPLLRD